MAFVGVRLRGESAGTSATGNWSQMSQGPACPGEPFLGKGGFGDPLLCVPSLSTGMWSRDRKEPFLSPLHIPRVTVQAIARRSHWDAAPFPPGCPGTALPLSREIGILWAELDFCGLLVLQWGTSKLWSRAQEGLAQSRAAGLTAPTHALGHCGCSAVEGPVLVSPLAQGHHTPPPLCLGHRPCPAALPQLPGKAPSRAGPGKKKLCTDRKISYLKRLLYCSGRWGRV